MDDVGKYYLIDASRLGILVFLSFLMALETRLDNAAWGLVVEVMTGTTILVSLPLPPIQPISFSYRQTYLSLTISWSQDGRLAPSISQRNIRTPFVLGFFLPEAFTILTSAIPLINPVPILKNTIIPTAPAPNKNIDLSKCDLTSHFPQYD